MLEERYLLCRVGRYTVAIGMDAVQHVGGAQTLAPGRGPSQVPVDLRTLLQVSAQEPGVAVDLRIGGTNVSLIVEVAARIETIAESAFAPLPPVFEHARSLFDGVCRRAIGGQHPLRLQLQSLAAPASAPL